MRLTAGERRYWTFICLVAVGAFALITYIGSEGKSRYLPFGLAMGAAGVFLVALVGLVKTRRLREHSRKMTSLPPNCLFVGGPLDGRRLFIPESKARADARLKMAESGSFWPHAYRVRVVDGGELPFQAESRG